MKRIKYVLLVTLILFSSSSFNLINAQERPVNMGFNVGMGLMNATGPKSTKLRLGYEVGITSDIAMTMDNKFYIQTGLQFKNKGFKKRGVSFDGVARTFSTNPQYLQIPVHAAYKLDVAPGKRIVFSAGPYIAFGVGGKMKLTNDQAGWDSILERNAFSNSQGIKRWDMGVGFGLAYEYTGLVFQFNYDFGLNNISRRGELFPGSIRNQHASVTIGFKM